MKVTRLVMAGALCALSVVPAMAQFSGVSGSKSGSTFPKVFPKSYDRVTLGYNANFFTGDHSGIWLLDGKPDDGMTMHGFALQYTHGFGISKAHPMYIEVGLKLGMGFFSDSESEPGYETKRSLTGLNLAIPVNFAYRFGIGKDLAITPYTGLHFKANLLAKGKYSVDYDYGGDDDYGYDYGYGSRYGDYDYDEDYDYGDGDGDSSVSMFDKDKVGGKDNAWKRVQVGWQIGAGLSYKAFYFGLEYGLDFNELYKKCSTSDLTVSVGLNF